MANRNGNTRDDAIYIDENFDDPQWNPAPKIRSVKRPPRPSIPPPEDAVQIDLTLSDDDDSNHNQVRSQTSNRTSSGNVHLDFTLSDNDDSNGEERRTQPSSHVGDTVVEQAASPVVHDKRGSDHRSRQTARGSATYWRNEYSFTTKNTRRTPSVKPTPPTAEIEVEEEHGISTSPLPGDAMNGVQPSHASDEVASTLETSRTVLAPSESASLVAAQHTGSLSRQTPKELPVIATEPAGQQKPNSALSDESLAQEDSTPFTAIDVMQVNALRGSAKISSPIVLSMKPSFSEHPPTPPHPNDTRSVPAKLSVLAHRNVAGPISPIGEFADHDCEQTNSSRVEPTTNTTPAFTRASADSGMRQSLDQVLSMPAKARRSHGPSVAITQQKQKAKKSIRLKDDDGSRSRLPIKKHDRPLVEAFVLSQKSSKEIRADQYSFEDLKASIRRSRSKDFSTNTDAVAVPKTRLEPTRQPIVGELPNLTPPHNEPNRSRPTLNVVSDPPTTDVATLSAQLPIEDPQNPHQFMQGPTVAAEEAATHVGIRNGNPQQPSIQLKSLEEPEIDIEMGQTSEKTTLLIDADDIDTARLAVEDCLRLHLAERHETHAYTTESIMRDQRTCHERELRGRYSGQKGLFPPELPKRYIQSVSPFTSMPSIEVPFYKKVTDTGFRDISQETFTKGTPKDTILRSSWAAPVTMYKSKAVVIPPFKEYVSLKTNILVDNESKLLATPYFQDENDKSREKLFSLLPYSYEMKHDENALLDLRREQCRCFKDSIEAFLLKLNVSWNDILYWLLAPDQTIRQINSTSGQDSQFEGLLLDRSSYHTEKFERDEELKTAILYERDSKQRQDFLSQVEKPTAKRLRLAAISCAAVLKECHFNIWYLAQQSESLQKGVSSKTEEPVVISRPTYKELMCRVCHQHNCLFHGEVREVPEDSWEARSVDNESVAQRDDDSEDQDGLAESKPSQHIFQPSNRDDGEEEDEEPRPAHFDDNSDIERVINYKLPANPNAFDARSESEMIESRGSRPPEGKFNSKWWLQHGFSHKWEERKPFFPCSHEGSCEQAQCRCYRENINCEKSCKCSRECRRRFPGCSCASTLEKRVCALQTCLCIKFNRECDADVCGTCGASEILDPVNRYNEDILYGRCCNVAIQRGVPRKTLLGHSEVHGFGLYMGEDIKKDEYIGEYTGETLSVREGNRRVTIYEYQQTMYLFKLNTKQEVDATYMGNKLRFINNADRKLTNCYPKNLLCNTVFRLALYASTDVKAGTELYFDYNYPEEKTVNFKQPNQSKGKVVAVKQTVKQTTKQKGKSIPSSSSSYKSPTASNIEHLSEERLRRISLATAKARAAKAAKRAAMLAEQAMRDSATSCRTGPQQARKTAPNESTRHRSARVTQLRGKGVKPVQGADSQDGSNASDSAMDTEESDYNLPRGVESQETQESTQVIQDTDEEDDDFVLEDTQEDAQNYEIPVIYEEDTALESGDASVRRISSRSRSMPSMAPVVAVKKKKGGARPGAGRKRKRPIVFNSDDE